MPVAAADSTTSTTPPVTQAAGSGHLLVRILSVPTLAQLETLLNNAETNGKITAAQAIKIETFWTNHHAQFVKIVKAKILARLMNVKSEANLKAFLDKAVSAGKITSAQEATIIGLWESAHSS
jgi:FMN-dependent NADH-azoreductase